MNENLEKELSNWWKEYKQAEIELQEKYPLNGNVLSNKHPINQLQEQFWKKKIDIYKKYNKLK